MWWFEGTELDLDRIPCFLPLWVYREGKVFHALPGIRRVPYVWVWCSMLFQVLDGSPMCVFGVCTSTQWYHWGCQPHVFQVCSCRNVCFACVCLCMYVCVCAHMYVCVCLCACVCVVCVVCVHTVGALNVRCVYLCGCRNVCVFVWLQVCVCCIEAWHVPWTFSLA